MTIYEDRYERVKELIEDLTDTYDNSRKEYKELATTHINHGAAYIQKTVRDAVSSGTSSLAVCNRLLIRLQKQVADDPKLRRNLFDHEDLPIEEIQVKVANALEHIALLNPYIVERLEQSIEYTKVLYDQTMLDGIP